jgi:recombination protein RecA
VIEKSGAWFSHDSIRIGQGRENAKKYLKENPETTAKIEKIIRDNAAGISEALLVGPSADDDAGDDEM